MNVVLLLLSTLLWRQEPAAERPKAVFAGKVLNTLTGAPVRNAQVLLFRRADPQDPPPNSDDASDGFGPSAEAWSDSTGAFEVANLPAGRYEVAPQKDGFWFDLSAQTNIAGLDSSFVLRDGEQKKDIVFRLTPLGAITGRVRDEDGDPIRHIQVTAMVYSYTATGRFLQQSGAETTDDRGEYRIFDLGPGRYYLRAGPPAGRKQGGDTATSYPVSYYPGVADPTAASWVELGPGQQLTGLNFVLRRAHLTTIRGRVIVPPGAVKPYLQVISLDAFGGWTASVDWPLKRDNSFVFTGLQPGPIQLFGGYQVGERFFTGSVALQVGTEEISGIELHPIPPLNIAGHVTVEGGSANPSRVQVSLIGPRRSQLAQVHEDGNFLLDNVESGAYQVYLNGLDIVYEKAIRWGASGNETDLVDGHLDLTKGVSANAQLKVVVGGDPGQITGSVSDTDLKPVSAWVVLASSSEASRRRAYQVISNGLGRFTFDNLPPGDYKIYAWRKEVDFGRVLYDPDYLRPVESDGRDVHVDPHSKQTVDAKVLDKMPK